MGKRKGRDERGGGFSGREDQYGGFGSQDRDGGPPGGGGGGGSGRGGGGAGGGPAGGNIKFQRVVPKFLQAHMGLLQRETPQDQEEPTVVGKDGTAAAGAGAGAGDDDSDDGRDDDGGALQRALEENAELAEDADVRRLVSRQKATQLKEKGNEAFSGKRYAEAVKVFSECIALDPDCELYYSNRSAAHVALKQYDEALVDAKAVVKLKPGWAKGYARLGAAQHGLEDFTAAAASYEKAMKIDPENESYSKARFKAEIAERQQAKDGKFKFKKRGGSHVVKSGDEGRKPAAAAGVGVKNSTLLSFDEGDE